MIDDSYSKLSAQLRWHVDRLAGLIGPRHLGQPKALAAAASLIDQELTEMGYSVERQLYRAGEHQVANLVAEIPGASRSNEIVILGAHYDTLPTTPGADDNASAVAVLLEVARLLQSNISHGARPRRTIRFAAFPCEEMPYCFTEEMGSQVHARRCQEGNERIVGMLCLEMVGFYTSEPGSQRPPPGIPKIFRWALPRRGDFLASVANLRSWRLLWKFRRGFRRAVKFPLFSIALPEKIRDIRRSDNSSFWDQGYPALMLTDTSYLRNPHYHQPTDTPDTLDYDSMAEVAWGVYGGLAELAGLGLNS